MLFDNITKNLKVKLSFGHKAVILSLSKLNIESKNFFYKSCSVWNVIQTWKKFIFVRKPNFGVEKCPQFHKVPKPIKGPKIAIFPLY